MFETYERYKYRVPPHQIHTFIIISTPHFSQPPSHTRYCQNNIEPPPSIGEDPLLTRIVVGVNRTSRSRTKDRPEIYRGCRRVEARRRTSRGRENSSRTTVPVPSLRVISCKSLG
ncbi:hypothetical protein HanXRQr2_Chr04g0180731 [Helianthus annuus]|uniref:Uncharacterized protein n=1 Tax=Helianthus annuus TaxID=4232 RepID=A0A251V1J5_HELAN|nr:hypothetical protein HanXRQr2_Chr04g0180731 [Helianthus annuus]KAJ0590165.1 hypothetical protein HanIR_Chr04g0194411 [Helianthus annuus]KAJ0932481.1 hypothetical protein HanPSC8_Chr04g0174141 [Helianthus annuus]